MSGPKRNPDSINTIGIVVIGVCASVLVYVTIVALQAFYMQDTAEIQTMADYGGNDTSARSVKAAAMQNLTEYAANQGKAGESITYRVPIDVAMKKVLENGAHPDQLIPGISSTEASAEPVFSRSIPLKATTPAAGSGSAGSGSGSATTDVPAVPLDVPAVPMTPTGGQAQGGGPMPQTGTNNAGSAQAGSAAPSAPEGNAP